MRPSFAALVGAEEELGSLLALVERAAAGQLRLAEVAALYWHCLAEREGIDRDGLSEELLGQGLARMTQPLRQLIEQHCLPRADGDDPYNFVDGGRVRRIPVTPALRAQITNGAVQIARHSDRYDLVPAAIAARIREQHPDAIVSLAGAAGTATPADDDPYRDFVVPDDLTW